MTPLIRCLTILFLLSFVSACSKTEPTPATPAPPPTPATAKTVTSESVVKVNAQPVEISAGGSADATVQLTIQAGYHVNANPPTFPYLRPTTLAVPPADGIKVGFITYPKPLNKTFPFAEKPLAIYEGETEVKVNLKSDKTAQLGQRSIPATLSIQACDDQVCYAPGKLELSIPINIK
ncbi:MAG TPA: protein-disulfide reductase DsbD domain-containing protein [Pyrinomonadaceae bacterium]|nr:protein-disulfide reductase DsbD domain-containing protein [Pyrinomonadaceae bacterium]